MITLTKIMVFVLIMCIINVIKEAIRFVVAYRTEKPYETTKLNSVFTIASLSYILTLIICGI